MKQEQVRLAKKTIFNNWMSPFLSFCSMFFLKSIGWKFDGEVTNLKKGVMITVPHTSALDLPMLLIAVLAAKKKAYWFGKKSLFSFPFCKFSRFMGGIPINRESPDGIVKQAAELFRDNDELALVVQPEGTRKKVTRWKTGFYRIAQEANVPIVLGFLDYEKKTCSARKEFIITGDMKADMAEIKKFYANVKGKNPRNQ